MSLEAALAENTATMKELIAALTAAGAVQNAQASAAAHSSPAVQAVVKAQKEADTKKPTTPAADAQNASGKPSAPTGESSSPESMPLQDWHEKTAELYAELKDGEPTLDNLRKAILGINQKIGRPQADAVMGRFGAQMITPKPGDKRASLDESQYPDVFAFALRVLAGEIDATASIVE